MSALRLTVERRVCVAAAASSVLLLASACTERDIGPDAPGSDVVWTYGAEDRIVLSSPVEDSHRNIIVLMGDLGACDECQQPWVERVSLASISPSGEELWSTEITAKARRRPVFGPGPIVSPDDEVTVCVDGDVVRVASDGVVRWRADGACSGNAGETFEDGCWDPAHAVAHDGTYAVLRRVVETDPARITEVLMFDRGGDLRWSRKVGVESTCWRGFDTPRHGTFVNGLAFDAMGRLVLGCDTCDVPPAIVRLDASNGELVDSVATPESAVGTNAVELQYAHYGEPMPVNGDIWLLTYACG